MKKEDGKNKWKYLIILVLAALILLFFFIGSGKEELVFKIDNFFSFVSSDWSMLLISSLLLIMLLCIVLFVYDSNKSRQMKEAEESYRRKSERDPLTDVYNRSIAQEIIEEKLKVNTDYHAFIMFDLDGLKNINDTFGHETGDHILKDFSAFCTDFFGEEAVVSRSGGDEFIVFLTDAEDEASLRKKMTEFFKNLSKKKTDDVCIHSYAGISAISGNATWSEMFKQADTALYVAKRGGKTPYVIFKKAHEREVLMSKQKLLGDYTDKDHDEMEFKSEFDANDMFVWFIESYELKSPEHLTLKNPKDFLMFVNPDDMSISKVISSPKNINNPYENWVGRKCYEAFAGKTEKCEECLYKVCNHNSYIVSETHSPVLNTDFIQRAGLFGTGEDTSFVHIFKAVENSEEANKEYRIAVACQNIITSCACSDVNYMEEPDRFFSETISSLCMYFKAEQGFITWNSGDNGTASFNMSEGELFAARKDISAYARKHWEAKLGKNVVVYVDNIAQIENIDARVYRFLENRGVKNFLLIPIWDKMNVYGFLCLKNIDRDTTEMSTAGAVSAMLLECMKVLTERDNMKSIRYYDETTGYLNFDGFKRCMRRILGNGKKYAFCAFDVIRFKYFNEVFGYDIGNIVLKNVADMFARMLSEEEFMCRISADNFCALFEYTDEEVLRTKIEDIVSAVANYFRLNYEGRYLVELAAGVYTIPVNNKDSVDTMLNMATIAKKRAKQEIGNKVRFYDEDLKTAAMREIELESSMDEAIRKEEFKVYLQPQVYIGKTGPETLYFRAEALCRWVRNNDFYALPSEFIPLFEHDGRITKLDMYMLDKACGIVRKLREEENMSTCIAVNLSRATILQPDFIENVESILSAYGIRPGEIELEFTEGVAVTNYERFAEIIRQLKKLGCYCAMDDFGSELSSLNVLQNLPVDVLKLDKKFFETKENDERQSSIVRDTINMARDLDMRTIAEGIENKRQVSMLRKAECDFIQGFVYARPMPVLEYVRWAKNN